MFFEGESGGAVIRSRRASPGLSAGGEFFCVSAKIFFCCKRLPVKQEGGRTGIENMFYNIFS